MTFKKSLQFFPLLLLFVIGCGEDPTKKDGANNTVRVRLEAPVKFINPVLTSTGYARFIGAHIFQTLGTLDLKTIEIHPLMVKSIPKLEQVTEGPYKDKYSCSFELLDEARWDNGTPITAADVEFSLKMIMHPLLDTKIWRGYIETVVGFEPDPTNPKKFTFYFGDYYILAVESASSFPIYPAYAYDPGNLLQNIHFNDLVDQKKAEELSKTNQPFIDFATAFNKPEMGTDKNKIVASGAYQVAFFDPAQGAILARKKDWWGYNAAKTNPDLIAITDTIHYVLAQAEDATINMLKSGDLDVANSISPAQFLELQKDPALTEKYDFRTHWMPGFNRIILNQRDPLLADKKVRQAMAYSVNYPEILNDIQKGMAERTIGPINPNNPDYAKNVVPYTFNPEKAKALLAEAGWADSDNDGVADKTIKGVKTDLVLKFMNTAGVPVADMISSSIQNSMAKSGIKIEIVAADLNTINKETMAGKFQMAATTQTWHPGTADFYQVYHSNNILPGDNRSGIANPELDQLIMTIRKTESREARHPMYVRCQEILNEELPDLFLYAPVTRVVSSKKFDFELTALRPGYFENRFKVKK